MTTEDSPAIQRTFRTSIPEMVSACINSMTDMLWEEDYVAPVEDYSAPVEYMMEMILTIRSQNDEKITKLFRGGATAMLIPHFDDKGCDYVKIEITKRDGSVLIINHEDIAW